MKLSRLQLAVGEMGTSFRGLFSVFFLIYLPLTRQLFISSQIRFALRSSSQPPFTSSIPVCCLKQSGGFYSAEDADSVPASGGPEKREGAFCVWTASEVRELLPDVVEGATGAATQADIFMHHYGVKEQGNVDPEQVLSFFYYVRCSL